MWRPVFYESRIERDGSAAILIVHGELDLSSERHFRHELEQLVDGNAAVIVDLGAVSYLDLSTIRGLEHYAAIARSRGSRLIVANPAPHVCRIFGILRLYHHLEVASSRQQALEWLRQRGP